MCSSTTPSTSSSDSNNSSHFSNNNSNNSSSNNNSYYHRMVLGSFLLLIVDLIWVLSSELSDYLYHEEQFDKPFFATYVKTGMFLVFLVRGIIRLGKDGEDEGGGGGRRRGNGYRLVVNNNEEEDEDDEQEEDVEEEEEDIHALSPSAFVPAYVTDTEEEGGGGVFAAAPAIDVNNHKKKVKFNRVAEVRHLPTPEAEEATLSRMSYAVSSTIETYSKLVRTMTISLVFCFMWFLANYTYALSISLSTSHVALVNVLSSSSSLFTLILSAVFPSEGKVDKLTPTKIVCVLASIMGVAVVSYSAEEEDHGQHNWIFWGCFWALVSAVFYSLYLVFLRRQATTQEEELDIFLFFGFVGLFNLLLLWPLFFLLHFSGIEVFTLPNKKQLLYLVLNGAVGTLVSEVLWVWASLLTSSLIATLGIALTIPMTMFADVLVKGVGYGVWFYLGAAPILVSFIIVTLDWDPLGKLCSGSRTLLVVPDEHDARDRESLLES